MLATGGTASVPTAGRLSAYDVKMSAPAVMAYAVHEPSAFEVVTSAPRGGQPV